jgi:aspartyl-tRNA synthetase
MELKSLEIELPEVSKPFSRITYSQLVENLQNSHKYIRWGDDIAPKLLKDLFGDEFYFITDWPASTKPFYVKSKKIDYISGPNTENDPHVLSESFDLMYGSLELSSGSTRINNKDNLMENMKKKGLSHQAFDYHLRVFDYGVPPHAGFGLGLERLLMAILKIDNIRDATFYPRDIDRLTP